MMLVTLEQAKQHLRVDYTQEDEHITLLVHAASGAAMNYLEEGAPFLDSNEEPEMDSNGDIVGVEYAIQAAVLLMVGYLYRLRDNNEGNEYTYGYLPFPVVSLLYPYRRPALS